MQCAGGGGDGTVRIYCVDKVGRGRPGRYTEGKRGSARADTVEHQASGPIPDSTEFSIRD